MIRSFKISILAIALFPLACLLLEYGESRYMELHTGKDNLLCIYGSSHQFPQAKQICYTSYARWELFGHHFGRKVALYFYVDKDGVRYPIP